MGRRTSIGISLNESDYFDMVYFYKEYDMTIAEIAEKFSVSRSYVSSVIRCRVKPEELKELKHKKSKQTVQDIHIRYGRKVDISLFPIAPKGKKYCHRCGNLRLLSCYYQDKRMPDQLRTVCSVCSKIDSLRYRKTRLKNIEYQYSVYLRNANRRNILFNITLEQFIEYRENDCCYCGSKIKNIGIDRVDNTKGYTIDNIVPCCSLCNYMKRDMSCEEFFSHCEKIFHYNND